MPKVREMKIGETFGNLTIISREGVDKNGFATWRCKCKCGKEKVYRGTALRQGGVISCGCSKKNAFDKIMTSRLNKMNKDLAIRTKYKINN